MCWSLGWPRSRHSARRPDPKDLVVPPEDVSPRRATSSAGWAARATATARRPKLELAKLGRRARQALDRGRRLRCRPRGPVAVAAAAPESPRPTTCKARIDTFLEDKGGKFEHNLPGLKSFRKAPWATTPKARELYVDILKSPYNLDMFAAMDRGKVEGGRAVSDRRNTLYSDMIQRNFVGGTRPTPPKQPSITDIAAVLLAESEIPHEFVPRTTIQWQQVSGVLLFNQNASMNAL